MKPTAGHGVPATLLSLQQAMGYLLAGAQVVSVQDARHVVAQLHGLGALLVVAREQAALHAAAHALQRRGRDHACAAQPCGIRCLMTCNMSQHAKRTHTALLAAEKSIRLPHAKQPQGSPIERQCWTS